MCPIHVRKVCPRIQHDDESNLFKTKQRLFHVIYACHSPKCKVKTKNDQKEMFLVALIRAQAGNLSHKQLVPMRPKI